MLQSRFSSFMLPLFGLLVVTVTACDKPPSPESSTPPESSDHPDAPAKQAQAGDAKSPTAAKATPATTKRPAAPDFTLTSTDGATFHLADHKGKVVVLEWFNPGCPFVKAAHTKGSLVDAAQRAVADGVVWVAINSGAPGKQGHGKAENEEGKQAFKLEHPILLDEDGKVGHAYGATNTPHLFVIDKEGRIAYQGAVDNSPDGEGQSPQGGPLVSYVDQALSELAAGKPVSTPKTKAYGCSVKY